MIKWRVKRDTDALPEGFGPINRALRFLPLLLDGARLETRKIDTADTLQVRAQPSWHRLASSGQCLSHHLKYNIRAIDRMGHDAGVRIGTTLAGGGLTIVRSRAAHRSS